MSVQSENEEDQQISFGLVGIAGTQEFQKCLTYIELLHNRFPDKYQEPQIRPMLDYDWEEYLVYAKRKYGGGFWTLKKQHVVFLNGTFLGDDEDLLEYLRKDMHIYLRRNYKCLGRAAVVDIFKKYTEIGRKFVYLTIAMNHQVIGNIIFMLYTDLVPKTCKNFLKKCRSRHQGYIGAPIHRIMQGSWIQFGGNHLKQHKWRSCENYKIPHNRRGVLSMCNNGRHKDNMTQFSVSLSPTDWMNCRYVAFGQMIQGNNILEKIEKCKTYYEHPNKDVIKIVNSGEFSFDSSVSEKAMKAIDDYIENRENNQVVDILDARAIPSELLEKNYKRGDYWFIKDNMHYPMDNYPYSSEEEFRMSIASSVEEEYDYDYDLLFDKYGISSEYILRLLSEGYQNDHLLSSVHLSNIQNVSRHHVLESILSMGGEG